MKTTAAPQFATKLSDEQLDSVSGGAILVNIGGTSPKSDPLSWSELARLPLSRLKLPKVSSTEPSSMGSSGIPLCKCKGESSDSWLSGPHLKHRLGTTLATPSAEKLVDAGGY